MAHDASATWSGFNYQGKVSILHTLTIINKKLDEDLDFDFTNYELKLEHHEDFEIITAGGPESFHQVKAYNETLYSKYSDSLLELTLELKNYPGVKGYLHTWKTIELEAGSTLKSKVVATIQAIIDEYDNLADKNASIILKSLSNGDKLNKKAKIIKNAHIQPQTGEGIKDYLKEAIADGANCTNRIESYKYPGNKYCCDLEELNVLIADELRKYYTKKTIAYTENQIDTVVKHFLGKLDAHIIERHKYLNDGDPIPIAFEEILRIADTDFEDMSVTYLANKFKDKFLSLLPQFCADPDHCSDINLCVEGDGCNWQDVTNILCKLPAEKLWEYYKGFSPHKNLASICNTENAFETDFESILIALFPIFRAIRSDIIIDGNDCFCYAPAKDRYEMYLPTTIDRGTRNKLAKNIILNPLMISKLYEIRNMICGNNVERIDDIAMALNISNYDVTLPDEADVKHKERIIWIKKNLRIIPLQEVEVTLNAN